MSEARRLVVEEACPDCGFVAPMRTVLSVPTDEMVEASAKAMFKAGADMEGNTYPRRLARTALTAAFNTLGIQETRHNPVDKRVTGPRQ
jgi:hypothetical protein